MRIEVRKIGRYDPTQGGKYDKYEGYCLSTDESVDLPLDNPVATKELDLVIPQLSGDLIISSRRLRALQTSEYLADRLNIPYSVTNTLHEIPFDLGRMVSKEEFAVSSSELVRERFIDQFVNDSLLESRQSIRARLETLFEEIENSNSSGLILVSHSFTMKIIEGLASGMDLFGNPKLLGQLIHASQKTYPFGGGFGFEI